MPIPATEVILLAPVDQYRVKKRRALNWDLSRMLRCIYPKSSAPPITNGESLARIQRCPATV
jgi:hypothetical protein